MEAFHCTKGSLDHSNVPHAKKKKKKYNVIYLQCIDFMCFVVLLYPLIYMFKTVTQKSHWRIYVYGDSWCYLLIHFIIFHVLVYI